MSDPDDNYIFLYIGLIALVVWALLEFVNLIILSH